MRVLVTGGAGFIGLEVVRRLLEGQAQVMAPVRNERAARRLNALDGAVKTPIASIDDHEAISGVVEAFQPEAAIHLAWYAKPSDYRTSAANLISLQSTIDLTNVLLDAGCHRLVYAGSCFEYRVAAGPRREADPTEPRSLYAATKLATWAVTGALAEARGAEIAWARIYFPYGPGESPDRLLPMVARRLAAGEQVDLTEGKQVRDQIHVTDVASGLVLLTEPGASGIYNLGTGVPVTMRQTVEALAALVGRPELLRFGAYAEREDEPATMFADTSKLRDRGWAPRYPAVADGLKASLAAYLGESDPSKSD